MFQTMPPVQSMAPNVVFRHPDGKPFRLSSLRGKMVVLTFSAYRCSPCRLLEAPLERFAREFPQVVFVTVSTGPASELPLLAALRPEGARSRLVQDPYFEDRSKMGVWKFGNVGSPTMFLIDAAGRMASKPMQGGAEDLPQLRSRIRWVASH